MMQEPGHVVPFSFDLSSLVQRSVASLYSHLVTRPTGRALRLGIESQIGEIGSSCLSILDFTQVVVLDYSCADEAVAKLLQRYQSNDRPADVYFVARGLGEQHRDPIDEVLLRHDLALVAEVAGEFTLLGRIDTFEFDAWQALQHVKLGDAGAVARHVAGSAADIEPALNRLALRRVVLQRSGGDFFALTTLLPGASG
jgi:hypothetical protein